MKTRKITGKERSKLMEALNITPDNMAKLEKAYSDSSPDEFIWTEHGPKNKRQK